MTEKTIVKIEEGNEVGQFITQAIEAKLPIETLERLFTLREKALAEKAHVAFNEAMAKFQKECPVIEKKKKVFEKGSKTDVRYSYATLDSIVTQVKEALGNNGLAYSFDEKKDDKMISAICRITHILGHSETSTFQIPIGTEAYMSDPQKHGARITFAKRYAFCNALGILTGDEDTDAVEEKKPIAETTDLKKSRAVELIRKLGYKDQGEELVTRIFDLTTLKPSAATIDEIVSRLSVLVNEKGNVNA